MTFGSYFVDSVGVSLVRTGNIERAILIKSQIPFLDVYPGAVHPVADTPEEGARGDIKLRTAAGLIAVQLPYQIMSWLDVASPFL